MLYKKGLSYSAINTARSMLPMMLPTCNGTTSTQLLHLCCRNLAATLHCQDTLTYDPDLILNFLKSLPSWDDITRKWLTLKTATILALLSVHKHINIDILLGHINSVIFYIPTVIKNTTRLIHQQPIEPKAYKKYESICPVCTVVE